jgi:medium-chain acyl-[acyl-carrier-protein] hydrolase
MSNKPATQWFSCHRPNEQAALRLFCFPYAGGGAPIFWNWMDHLPRSVEVCPVQLPGRGSRGAEAPHTRLRSLVEELAEALYPYMDKPSVFYGHSMGALISFELARELRRRHGFAPERLIVSGCSAPQRVTWDETHELPDDLFIEHLRELNGTPAELLDHQELMQLMLPVIRADFAALETYEYDEEPPLGCPLTAIGGLQDDTVSIDDLKSWREQTASSFTVRMLPGDHFFIHSAKEQLLQVLSRELLLLSARVQAIRGGGATTDALVGLNVATP